MDLSVILPIFNESENIEILSNELIEVISKLNLSFEIIFIDDGSTDSTLITLRRLNSHNANIKILSFSRNFGHQIAVTAGLGYATGDAVITMDSDLQDEPKFIPQFIEKWKQGYDCVYAVRVKRSESRLRTFFFNSFYKVFNLLSNIKIPQNAGDFCLMDRKVVDAIKKLPEQHRLIRGIRSWVGFKQTQIFQERPSRKDQSSIKHGLGKLFGIGLDGIFSFSYAPMRIASMVGVLTILVGTTLSIKIFYEKIFTSKPIIGWTSVMLTIIFFSGVIILFLGIIGEYLLRIYDETKGRPLFILKEKVGFE